MEIAELLLTLVKDYDLATVVIVAYVYVWMNKRLKAVDKAVNHRSPDQPTMSQEVSEIHRKIDIANVKSEFLVKQFEEHTEQDSKAFTRIYDQMSAIDRKVARLSNN